MKIQSSLLTASFKSKGGELVSLKDNRGVEYIWAGNPEYWNRHTPVLFPIVGRLKDDQFTYQEKAYTLNQHGFARDSEFVTKRVNQDEICFTLRSNYLTKEKFPFEFELKINHRLEENKLTTTYEVLNTQADPMHFSIGGHPAFSCPMAKEGHRSDYFLRFDKEEKAYAHLNEGGLFTGETLLTFQGTDLPITDHLFDHDALVFKHLRSSSVTLMRNSKSFLSLHFEGFPYLGIWSKSRQSPFICIEPWYGLADSQNASGDLSKKEGIQSLESGQTFSCSYTIEIHTK